MADVMDFYRTMDKLAPFSTQMSFDNAGFLVGRGGQKVSVVLISLDITEEVVQEAVQCGAELIVSHHPVIFHPAKSVTDQDPTGRILLALTEHKIAAVCAHTNLDAAVGGVNDALAHTLGLSSAQVLHTDGMDEQGRPYGIGRIGVLTVDSGCTLPNFAACVKQKLNASGVRFVDAGRPVCRVAVGGGACGDMLGDVLRLGGDTFVTADVKYNAFLDARAMGLNLIDAGHFSTENVICPVLEETLHAAFPAVKILRSACHHEVFSCL